MSEILIIGGGGMVGQKLAHSLGSDPLNGDPNTNVTLYDMAFPTDGAAASRQLRHNVTDKSAMADAIAARPDPIFYLAAIVSGESETNFDLGWHVNLHAFWQFLEIVRAENLASGGTYRPRVVFTSSIAVFGPPYPDKIDDMFPCIPQTSYGAQKAASELMLSDLSRKGFIDGIALRLPTICVRPGKANLAASSFFSGIIREPLNGQEANLPVAPSTRHWHASPRSAVGFLRHAATLDTDRLEGHRALNLPGVSCAVAEQIEALRDIAGQGAVDLIKPQPDATIMRIVGGWPRDFAPDRAVQLGFRADDSFAEIIKTYIEDDLPGGLSAPA